MKVCIITIIDYKNYGNRLQNYALDRLLKDENLEVQSGIVYFLKDEWVENTTSKMAKFIKCLIPIKVCKMYLEKKYNSKQYDELMQLRIEKFKEFTKKNIETIPEIYGKNIDDLREQINEKEFDFFIAGSDQVWNPYYRGKWGDFLKFADKKKRLSFSASIGLNYIPKEKENYYKTSLMDMHYISVREESAIQLIKNLTGREAKLTLDPTLLISKEHWKNMAKKPNMDIEENYICTYFLGEIPIAVDKFAKSKNIKIYHINSTLDKEFYTLDPAEFVYMIMNARYILTDSFHAVAFSIKLNKEFYVFDRKQRGVSSMFARIETITKQFGMENRIQDRNCIIEQESISKEKWDIIEEKLNNERKKSMSDLLKIIMDNE